jgi:phosphinothricin acetyltransferase
MPTAAFSTSEATLRPASLADAAAVAAIYAPHVLEGTGTFETEPPPAQDMAARMERVLNRGWPWLVLDLGGEPIGYAYAAQFRDRAAYAMTGETSVYLRGDQVGRGFGRLLLSGLLGASVQCGFREMVAVIGDSGNAASIGVHRALGFREVGTLMGVGFKFGRWLDVVLMQKSLTPSA